MIKKNKKFARNEFRFNYDTKHMNYVFEEDKKKFHCIGITHKKKTNGKKNCLLNKNVQKNKIEKSYLRYGIVTNKINSYSKNSDKRFCFSKEDYAIVKSKIRNYKKNR